MGRKRKKIFSSCLFFAKEPNIDQTRIFEIINKKRSITADSAFRLSIFFGNTPQFWLGLQIVYYIEEEKTHKEDELKKIRKFQVAQNL